MPHPPELAELILRGLLPLDMGETVSGDLLEEYREARVPAVGEFRADAWYWRQVAGMWLRAYWWLVVSAILVEVVHDVFNTFRAPSGAFYLDGLPTLVVAVLSPLSPLGVVGVLGIATAYGSWRAGRWQGGLVAALGVSAMVWVFMAARGIASGFDRDAAAGLIVAGFVLLATSMFFGGIAAVIGEIILPPAGPRGRRIIRHVLLGLGAASFVSIGLLVSPRAVPPAEVALWAATGGPPLDFEAPHDGQVVAHMDLMGGVPPDIARIRISEVASGTAVWDVAPAPALRVCWNGCWNLTLRAGENRASFAAGRQRFKATVPSVPTFVLARGTAYFFEVWDSKGRVQRHAFTL
jgi:hypothetical protein